MPRLLPRLIPLAAAVMLAACGGSDDAAPSASSTPTPAQLQGLAATGAAIPDAPVAARCASGPELSGRTGADGSFTLVLDGGQTLPCLLRVTPPAPGTALHSFASAAGRVNLTPFTELLLARAAVATPADSYATFDAAHGAALKTALADAKTYLDAQLAGAGLPAANLDALSGVFAIGDAHDQALDALQERLQQTAKTLAELSATAADGQDFSGLIGAEAPVPDGSDDLANDPVNFPPKAALAGTLPGVKKSGADIPWLVGSYTGTDPSAGNAACTLTVAGDGTLSLASGGKTLSVRLDGHEGDYIQSYPTGGFGTLVRAVASDTDYLAANAQVSVQPDGTLRSASFNAPATSASLGCLFGSPQLTPQLADLRGSLAIAAGTGLDGSVLQRLPTRYSGSGSKVQLRNGQPVAGWPQSGACTLTRTAEGVLTLSVGTTGISATLDGGPDDLASTAESAWPALNLSAKTRIANHVPGTLVSAASDNRSVHLRIADTYFFEGVAGASANLVEGDVTTQLNCVFRP